MRLVESASAPTNWTGAQFVLASQHFDVAQGSPQPPGAWLYAAIGHAVHVVTGLGSVTSLVLLAAVASSAAAAATSVAGTLLVGRWVGLAAAALVAFSPISWFEGSTVSTYSFCALVAPLLIVLARLARPGGHHVLGAVAILAVATGFMPWVLPMFAVLALLSMFASIRSSRQLLGVVVVAAASFALWFAPMIAVQPGHLSAWARSLREVVRSLAHASSVFYNTAGGQKNFGAFGAYIVLSLWPALVLFLLAVAVLTSARVATHGPAGDVSRRIWSGSGSRTDLALDAPGRPWYQRSGSILSAAVVPPVAIFSAGRFPSGGAVLSLLPASTILLLWPLSRLIRHRSRNLRRAGAAVATAAVLAACVVDSVQFLGSPGILPESLLHLNSALWVSENRYGAPYPDTAAAISASDDAATSLRALGRLLNPRQDVLAVLQAGATPTADVSANTGSAQPSAADCFRVAGVELRSTRIAYLYGSAVRFVEQAGALRYVRSSTLAIPSGGNVLFLVQGGSRAMAVLAAAGEANKVSPDVAGLAAWEVEAGTDVLGVSVVSEP